jgi:hypothetical protein
LILSQLSHAGPTEVRSMSPAEARARVERSTTYREIVAAREAGRDITADPKLMEKVTKMVDLSLTGVVTLSATEKSGMMKLININAIDVLTEVARLSSISKDAASNAKTKARAAKSLKLIGKAAHTVNSLARNSADAQKQIQGVKSIIEISEKISALDYGTSSTEFISKYEKALNEGKSIEEAVRVASNGKFTERELRECE